MSKIGFGGFWSKQWQSQYNVPKGFLLIKVKDVYKKKLGIFLNKLHGYQAKKKELKELDFTSEFHYRKRGSSQNNLMWALYTIEANEMNGGMQGAKEQMVTAEELYENDLISFAPKIEIKIPAEQYNYYKSNYRVEKEDPFYDKNGNILKYEMTLIESTSHFNTVQMAKWIDRQFNRMAYNGISCTNPGEIHDYWVKWRSRLNSEKIIIHDSFLTPSEYRKLNPICEATGDLIADGKGHISHIKVKGMGGKHEIEKDYASNLLHLCHEAHIETQHQKGWEHFLKVYPHLTYKVNTALRRDYLGEEIKC